MTLAGTEVPIVWRGRRAHAFVPQLLADRSLTLDARTAARCGGAEMSVTSGAESLGADHVPLARLLLRAEGIASSYIEGVTAPVVNIVLAEATPPGTAPSDAAAWVAANLAAADEAITHATGTDPLEVDELCHWHALLMAGSPTPAHHVGRLRDEQAWIGGTSPLDAHLVTPPWEEVPGLVDDLLGFVNATDLDPIAAAAITHAQFELVHPFADGNGRIGRILISWVLTRRLHLLTPPPVSTNLAADVGGYTAGLTRFRFGETSAWVAWFADAVSGAGRAQRQLVEGVVRLRARWEEQLGALGRTRALRADSSARRALNVMPCHLVLTAAELAAALGISRQAAGEALATLTDAGVLTPIGAAVGGRGRPPLRYVSEDLLSLTGATPLRR